MMFSKLLIGSVVALCGLALTADEAQANCYGQVAIVQRQRLRIRRPIIQRQRIIQRQIIQKQIVQPIYAQPVVAVQQVVQPLYVAQPVAIIQKQYAAPVVQPSCALGICEQQQLQNYQSPLCQ